jgi:hypothetical protein
MLRMEQSELAEKAQISVETVKRLEAQDGPILTGRAATLDAIERALTKAGVEFTNGDAPGVRMKLKR